MPIPNDDAFHELARRIPAQLPGEQLFTMDIYDDHRDLRFPARDTGTGWPAFRPEVAAIVVDWLNTLHEAEPTGFDSAVWRGSTILVTLTGFPDEPPIAIDPRPDGRYIDIGAVTGWRWVIADPNTSDSTASATAILALFTRLQAIQHRDDGTPGAEAVQALQAWFAELGIDADADLAAATRALRLPAPPPAGEITVHIRAAHADLDSAVRTWVTALITVLGPNTSAVMIDSAGRESIHHTRPGTDPAQS